MQKTLLLFCLLSGFAAAAQRRGYSSIPARYTIIFVEPAAAIDFFNGASIRLGAEHKWCKKWSLSGTGGVYVEKGFMGKLEVKYLVRDNRSDRHSVSLEYEHKQHQHTTDDFYRKPDSREGYLPDESRPVSYSSDKHINQLNAKYVYDQFWQRHWWLEAYAGLGIKFKTTTNSISDAEQDNLYHFHESVIRNFSFSGGTFVQPAVVIGIKFGFVFSKKQSA